MPQHYWNIRQKTNRFLGRAAKAVGTSRAWGFPTALMVEPTNHCNLSCYLCPTGAGWIKHARGYLDVQAFENLINEIGPYLQRIAFWNWGEPFLHPQMLDLVAEARRHPAWLQIATNGHCFSDPKFAYQVAASGLDQVIIAIDGSSTASIQAYRGPHANLDKVLVGLHNLALARRELGSPKPRLEVQFLVMAHNENEIEETRSIAENCGADRFYCKTLNLRPQDISRQGAAELWLPRDPQYSRFVRTPQGQWTVRGEPTGICPYTYETAVLLWDGSLVPCCYDAEEDIILGNAFESGFAAAWNSPEYQNFRWNVRHHRTSIPMCTWCPEERRAERSRLGYFWNELKPET